MDFAGRVEATAALRRSGLLVKGAESQHLRLLIRATRNRFTAINESGYPMFIALFEAAHVSAAIRNAILALAGCLQVTTPHPSYASDAPSPELANPTAARNYQASLAELRSKIANLQHGAPGGDAFEILGCVMMLVSAGFPSTVGSAGAGDWALHIAGMVSLVESLDVRTIESTVIARISRELAAGLSIGAFSLGCTRNLGCAWLDWNIHPPEAPPEPDFSPLEVLRGYPKSLLTVMATMSAVLEQQAEGHVRPLIRDTVQRLFDVACRRGNTAVGTSCNVPSVTSTTWRPHSLLSMLDTVITAWEPPDIPSRISIDVATALTNAWKVMQKAALIYLWRGGFSATVTRTLSPEHARATTKFIQEMILVLHALLHAHDERGITIMSGMIWPVIVIGNETGSSLDLQREVLFLLREINRRFSIPHLGDLADLLRMLWQRFEQGSRSLEGSSVSLEGIARELEACLPLF